MTKSSSLSRDPSSSIFDSGELSRFGGVTMSTAKEVSSEGVSAGIWATAVLFEVDDGVDRLYPRMGRSLTTQYRLCYRFEC